MLVIRAVRGLWQQLRALVRDGLTGRLDGS